MQNPVTVPGVQQLTANGTAGTFTINFTSPGLTGVSATVTTTVPDSFLVTVNTDTFNDLQTLCVNQKAGGYNTGNTTNNSACSLRGALDAANNTSNAVITFAANVGSMATPGTITLVQSLESDTPVTLVGPGSTALTIDGINSQSIFDMESDDNTRISGLRLANASQDALYNDGGTITLNDVVVTNSGENDWYGTVIIANSSFLNTAQSNTALYIGDQATLSNMTFQGNTGPSLYVDGQTMLTNSAFLNNANASSFGSTIGVGNTSLTATNVTLAGNSGISNAAVALQGGGSDFRQ